MTINISRICTGNNTIMTAWDSQNSKTIKTISAGRIGLKGARRGSPYASELVGREIGKIIHNYSFNSNNSKPTINIYLSGKMMPLGSGLRGIRFGLKKITINQIEDVSPKPHNGCRSRKPRRV